ncbi:MAG: uracil-DNA glycosylase family protein [Rhodoferax sp.]
MCAPHLPCGPRPVLQTARRARVLVVGQAPGRRVHETGIPFNDPSGERLRSWLGLERAAFYDAAQVALVPMGFCYPGTGRSGDLPPRPECAATWRAPLLALLPHIQLTLVIGQYALAWHLPQHQGTLADAVRANPYRDGALWVLPHPSPRNNRWLRQHPWFEAEMLTALRERVQAVLA